ncbi:MAG: YbaB/EbfC family nucleoid-associated protein [Gammaproteobacteria bacterium]|nr:YbaB/EbfC family nucleoid-associated protein [Gammaproteobacteria bacterium]MDE0508575.1 YbaB/EbfC family nucleoid-associated protein [Gammaproteobacteria bacterium]MXY90684.1 YbaB/EbfC family nucleoid-associated protein [Gammaproteobacteria bacterium]MXZ32429.1 YbaB/EbfC family nucleoid-associated protein [Gammaproteobacteria bacterium]MYA37916.1 YbaB/EbfC family nucleoid-associated protein [Gammaproteobacteria bacterium]
MTDFNELMKQAKQVKDKMEQAKQELAATVVVGQSGAGAVKVRMNGSFDAIGVEIDEALQSEDKEILEDLICAAINDAVRKIEQESRQAMRGMAGFAGLPEGFKFPF